MSNQSVLLSQKSKSVLGSQSPLSQSSGKRGGKNLQFSINLTTLIDAFCILVIFLLSNMSTQAENVNISSKITLPSAKQSDLMSMGTVVKIEGNELFVDDVAIQQKDLVANLVAKQQSQLPETEIKKKQALIIQADRESDFEIIGDILRAGGMAGFTNYMFAVLPGMK